MMELFSQWLLGVTGTTLVIAVIDGFTPSGAVKPVGRLIGGLVLFLMVVKPLVSLSPESLTDISGAWQKSYESESEEMKNYYNEQLKSIIEMELASYIVDKATAEGITCHAVVHCVLEEVYAPYFVELEGIPSPWHSFFITMIVEDLGVQADGIKFKEVENEEPILESVERGDNGI
ncbi:MAG: hypothetical protein R3Y63_00865 [Eubacteriales bacterium]